MQLDATIACDPVVGARLAAELEAGGYDGVWTAETQHDPFLPLAAASVSTSRVTLGTGGRMMRGAALLSVRRRGSIRTPSLSPVPPRSAHKRPTPDPFVDKNV